MIDQDVLVRSVVEATSEVFSTMLDMQVQHEGTVCDSTPSGTGLISLVGITGGWGGSGVFCCSPVLASLISSRMLGTELDSSRSVIDRPFTDRSVIDRPVINEEVLDVVAEVTNMMIGNIKNGLEPVTGPLAISVPTVIHGRNFQFRNACGLRGTSMAFSTEGERFEVRIALAPASERPAIRSRIPVLGLAQV